MKLRRVFAFAIAAVMAIAVSGCGNGSKSTSSEAGEVSMLIHSHDTWAYNSEWWIWKALSENTNIKFNHTAVANSNYEEKLNMLIASGDAPDILELDVNQANKFGKMGALMSLEELSEDMPNFEKYAKENESHMRNLVSDGGDIYVLPSTGYSDAGRFGWLYRKDIFEKHGLEVPTTSEELYNVLKKLKELYPSSYPFTFRSYASRMKLFLYSWDTGRDYYYDHDDNTWKFAPFDPGYKEAMEYMNKLYTDGMIPPDFMTISTENWISMLSTDEAFITIDYLVRIDEMNNLMREKNPDYTLACMPPIKGGTYGKQVFPNGAYGTNGLSVYTNSKNLDSAKRFLEYLYSDEGKELVSWGKEGETYTVENGERKFIDADTLTDVRMKYGINTSGMRLLYDVSAEQSTFTPELLDAVQLSEKYDLPIDPRPLFTQEETDNIFGKYATPLSRFVNEQSSQFILGNKPFSEWDSYLKAAKEDYHVDEVMNLYNEGTKRFFDAEIKY